jgi:hypothetical protein
VTNTENIPVGTTIVTTNADGSVEMRTLVSRTEYRYSDVILWFTAVLAIALLLHFAFKAAKRNSKQE